VIAHLIALTAAFARAFARAFTSAIAGALITHARGIQDDSVISLGLVLAGLVAIPHTVSNPAVSLGLLAVAGVFAHTLASAVALVLAVTSTIARAFAIQNHHGVITLTTAVTLAGSVALALALAFARALAGTITGALALTGLITIPVAIPMLVLILFLFLGLHLIFARFSFTGSPALTCKRHGRS